MAIMPRETAVTMNTSPPIAKNVLLTGLPGCGKTTVIGRIVGRLTQLRLAGFHTREIRERGGRRGFEAIGLHGSAVVLAHVDFSGRQRVGRYGVDVAGFERLIKTELSGTSTDADVFVIDEIGKMECLSHIFIEQTNRILASTVPVLATIAAKGGGFISDVKKRDDVEIVRVTTANRDELPDRIAQRLREGRW
jgi:nucleoside-triphosphatase